MSVQKNRQAAGSWSIQLLPYTPRAVTDVLRMQTTGVGPFGQIVITSAQVDPTAIGATNLLGLSIYTGVYRTQKDRYNIGGAHATIWLGDEDGKAFLNEAAVAATQTFSNWVAAIIPTQLTTGTVTNPSGSTRAYNYVWSNQDTSPRQALTTICDIFGTEFEVTDQLTLNAATAATLYGSPTVIATSGRQGRDGTYTALRSRIGYTADVEDYTTEVLLLYNSGSSSYDAVGSSNFKDGQGATLVWKRKVESPDTTNATAAGAIGDQQLTRFNQLRQAITISTDSPAVMRDVRCGAFIYTYAPEIDLYDLTNPVTYQGETIYPVLVRVEAVTMPVTAGLGVYFLPGDGTVTDLTNWVAYESPGATVTVGAPQRRLSTSVQPRGGVGS